VLSSPNTRSATTHHSSTAAIASALKLKQQQPQTACRDYRSDRQTAVRSASPTRTGVVPLVLASLHSVIKPASILRQAETARAHRNIETA
jgi:hypothetical protein